MFSFTISQFKSLSIYDRYNIAAEFLELVKDLQRSSPATFGLCTRFPTANQVSLLYQLLMLSGNIHDILEFTQLLLVVPDIEEEPCMAAYPSKLLQVAAMTRKHFACVVKSPELASAIFTGYV